MRAPAGGLGPLDDQMWDTPRANPAVQSLQFVDWVLPAAPGLPSAPAYILYGVFLAAVQYSTAAADSTAFKAANVLIDEVGVAACSTFNHELAKAGIYEQQYKTLDDFCDAVAESTRVDRTVFLLRAAHVSNTESFDTPRGGPAGPAELGFLLRVTWWQVLTEGTKAMSSRPCFLLAQLFLLLGSKSRRNTRGDDMSDLRISAEMLRSWVLRTPPTLDAAASDGLIAQKVPGFMGKTSQHMLAVMRSPAASMEAVRDDIGDAFVLITGREAEISATLWRRAAERMDQFYVLSAFQPVLGNAADLKVQMERLAGHFLPAGRSSNPFTLMLELDRKLNDRGKRNEIDDLVTSSSDFGSIVTSLLAGVELSNSAGGDNAGGGGGGSAGGASAVGTSAGSGSLQASRADQAMSAPPFRQAVEACQNGSLTGREFLERCFRSGSALLHRYGVFAPAWLRPRHAFFETFHAQLYAKREYLTHAVAMDETTKEVPVALRSLLLDEELCDQFFMGRWLQMDCWNRGFLLLRAQLHSTVYNRVDALDFFVVESCLVGYKSFFGRLLLAVNYPSDSMVGYTFEETVDRQIQVVQYIQGLPAPEQPAWYSWARENFKTHALGRAQAIYLEYVEASIPAEARLDYFLPDGAAFFTNIDNRMKQAEPISVVRQAFPSLFPSTTISLPGTTSTQPSGGGGTADADADGGGSGGGGGQGGGGGKKRPGQGGGGAKGNGGSIFKMLDENTLFLAGRVYDIAGAAKELKVDKKKFCWARLFTTKQGADADAICTDKSHDAAAHTPPPKFNREAFAKKYSSKATAEQCKAAGWFSLSKKPKP